MCSNSDRHIRFGKYASVAAELGPIVSSHNTRNGDLLQPMAAWDILERYAMLF